MTIVRVTGGRFFAEPMVSGGISAWRSGRVSIEEPLQSAMARESAEGDRIRRESVLLIRSLDRFHERHPIAVVLHGGAPGADRWAQAWADIRGVETRVFEADWKAHGKAAGPLRNRQMLAEGRPDWVIAFPSGAGTADMIRAAMEAGVRVWRPDPVAA